MSHILRLFWFLNPTFSHYDSWKTQHPFIQMSDLSLTTALRREWTLTLYANICRSAAKNKWNEHLYSTLRQFKTTFWSRCFPSDFYFKDFHRYPILLSYQDSSSKVSQDKFFHSSPSFPHSQPQYNLMHHIAVSLPSFSPFLILVTSIHLFQFIALRLQGLSFCKQSIFGSRKMNLGKSRTAWWKVGRKYRPIYFLEFFNLWSYFTRSRIYPAT